MPARIMARSTLSSEDAGPMVATIFVRLMSVFLTNFPPPA
jgi:hypothetical protein